MCGLKLIGEAILYRFLWNEAVISRPGVKFYQLDNSLFKSSQRFTDYIQSAEFICKGTSKDQMFVTMLLSALAYSAFHSYHYITPGNTNVSIDLTPSIPTALLRCKFSSQVIKHYMSGDKLLIRLRVVSMMLENIRCISKAGRGISSDLPKIRICTNFWNQFTFSYQGSK